MKKTLIALAAVAATSVFAQSTVTIFGTFDPSIANTSVTYGSGASFSNTSERNNAQGTSQITFTGTEDLGGGLKAMFLMENDFFAGATTGAGATSAVAVTAPVAPATVPTKTALTGNVPYVTGNAAGNLLGTAGGELYAGFSGSFGSIKLGGANTPTLTTQASRQPFSTKIGGGFSTTCQTAAAACAATTFGIGVLGTGHVRESNSVVYASPSMSGFSVQLGYALAELGVPSAAAVGVAKSDLGLFYADGPISAGATFYSQSGVNSLTTLFASYVLGDAKIIVGYHTEDMTVINATTTNWSGVALANGSVHNFTGSNIAGTYKFTPALAFLGNYARLTTPSTFAQDKSILGLGLKYELSKRTSLYTRFVKESMDNATATQLSEQRTMLVGTQINF